MKRISLIGSLLRKIYRHYSSDLLTQLQRTGFTDLRPSFLEILMYLTENEGPSIKEIGLACGLKKQTMTSHLNELEKRGYIIRKVSASDKREQNIFLTDYGEKFKFSLLQVISDIESLYSEQFGELEMERVHVMLESLFRSLQDQSA